jgi:hypothetical protein
MNTYVSTHFGDVLRTVDVWKVKLLTQLDVCLDGVQREGVFRTFAGWIAD